jgi:hypothetical protein
VFIGKSFNMNIPSSAERVKEIPKERKMKSIERGMITPETINFQWFTIIYCPKI